MFFMIGISDGRKNFDFHQQMICDACGRYGRYQVFMTYTVLLLFFLPCLKWNKHYYVQTSCCGTIYELNPEIGKCIARGDEAEILPQHLRFVQGRGYQSFFRRCSACGYETTDLDFEFCPKCGRKFD